MADPGVQVGIRRYLRAAAAPQPGTGPSASGNNGSGAGTQLAAAVGSSGAGPANAGGAAPGGAARPVLFELLALAGPPAAAPLATRAQQLATPPVQQHKQQRAVAGGEACTSGGGPWLPPFRVQGGRPRDHKQKKPQQQLGRTQQHQHQQACQREEEQHQERQRWHLQGWLAEQPGQQGGRKKRAARFPQPRQPAKRLHDAGAPVQHLLGPLRTRALEPEARCGAEPEGGFNYFDDGAGEMVRARPLLGATRRCACHPAAGAGAAVDRCLSWPCCLCPLSCPSSNPAGRLYDWPQRRAPARGGARLGGGRPLRLDPHVARLRCAH
jgi:hypothetical protein